MKLKVLIIFLLFCTIVCFIIFVNGNENHLTNEEILKLGEEKYLSLLWMVKGAFEDKKIIVNNHELDDSQKVFNCHFNDSQKECIGNNFEEAFNQVFSKNISYEKVYGDGVTHVWIKKIGDDYHFAYNFYCRDNHDEDNYQLSIKSVSDVKIVYEITALNSSKSFTRTFILTKEDNKWKISQAVYRDKCMMDYYIS